MQSQTERRITISIGKNIAKYRKSKGFTQEELGAKLGVTNQSVSKWESEVSMPDVMLLPQIASILEVSLEDLYGIARNPEKISVSADDFPSMCHQKLIDFFYYGTNMQFAQKLTNGFRNACLSNTRGAIVVNEDFAFIDKSYKGEGSECVIQSKGSDDYTLMYLTDRNLRKVFYYQYKTAFERSKESDTEFTFDEIMSGCNLTEGETVCALHNLKEIGINEVYTDKETQKKKYVFLMSKALYAHAIYKIVELLDEDACWNIVRDTSIILDYAFEK